MKHRRTTWQSQRFPNRRGVNQEEVDKMVPSVKEFGILSALWVMGPNKKKEYDLIAGFHRLEAARKAGLKAVPIDVKKVKAEHVPLLQGLENERRTDMTELERAHLYQGYKDGGMTQVEIADLMGCSAPEVSQRLKILKAHPDVQAAFGKGSLTYTDVRNLGSLPQDEQAAALKVALNEAQAAAPTRPGKPPTKSKGKMPTKKDAPKKKRNKKQAATSKAVKKAVEKKKPVTKEAAKKKATKAATFKKEILPTWTKQFEMSNKVTTKQVEGAKLAIAWLFRKGRLNIEG
jgi:ParB family chromosome partitioning protein